MDRPYNHRAGRRQAVSGADGKKAALKAIRLGWSLRSLEVNRPDWCPHYTTIAKWRRDDVHFDREFRRAVKERGIGWKRRDLWRRCTRKYTDALPDLMAEIRCGGSFTKSCEARGWGDSSFRKFVKKHPAVREMASDVSKLCKVLRYENQGNDWWAPVFKQPTDRDLAAVRARAARLSARMLKKVQAEVSAEIDRRSLLYARSMARAEKEAAKLQRDRKQLVNKTDRVQGLKLRASLLKDEVYAAAERAVSKQIDPIDRADIITDIVMAVLGNEIELSDIPAAAKMFASEHMENFRSKKIASLDEQRFDDGDETYLDSVTTDDFDYAD